MRNRVGESARARGWGLGLGRLGLAAIGAGLLLAAVQAPASAEAEYKLKLHHFLGPKAPAHTQMLEPWAKRIEAAMNAALLTETQRKTMFIEHDLSGLLRGDVEARFEAYRVGREGGWRNGEGRGKRQAKAGGDGQPGKGGADGECE